MQPLYKTPFRPAIILGKQLHPNCDLRRSIAQNLHLLLCTRLGEYRLEDTYGCPIWAHDFDNNPGTGFWREQMAQAIRERINRFERRLDKARVTVLVTQELVPARPGGGQPTFKRKMDVKIEAVLSATQEEYRFTNQIYISPFSYD